MDWKLHLTTLVLALSIGTLAWAAPDEEKLGKRLGYPIAKIGNNKDWYYDESVRVGSFTHQAEIPGLYQGKANVLQRSGTPMRLATAPREPDYRWSIDKERDLNVANFLARRDALLRQEVDNSSITSGRPPSNEQIVIEFSADRLTQRPGPNVLFDGLAKVEEQSDLTTRSTRTRRKRRAGYRERYLVT